MTKRYHFIYKTTCLTTEKFYVGMHSTDNLDDGYLGSGKILGYSRKKYGDESHRLEILEHCDSRDELKRREKEIVNEDLLADPLNMNLMFGGEGDWRAVNARLTPEQRTKAGLAGGFANRDKWSEETKKRVSEINSIISSDYQAKFRHEHPELAAEFTRRACEGARTAESIAKRKNTFKERGHSQGEKNSQFGTCWVTPPGEKPIKIRKEFLDEFIKNGYLLGRKTEKQK